MKIITKLAMLIVCRVHRCHKVQLVQRHMKVRVQYHDSYSTKDQ